MINMKESYLIIFLSQNKEKSVSKFNDFGKVIPPQHPGHLQERIWKINNVILKQIFSWFKETIEQNTNSFWRYSTVAKNED